MTIKFAQSHVDTDDCCSLIEQALVLAWSFGSSDINFETNVYGNTNDGDFEINITSLE